MKVQRNRSKSDYIVYFVVYSAKDSSWAAHVCGVPNVTAGMFALCKTQRSQVQ